MVACGPSAHASVSVDVHVVDEHLRGELAGAVDVAGPIAAHGEIEQDELRSLVEGPRSLGAFGREGLVGMRGIVDVKLYLPLRPRHSVYVPVGGGESRGAIRSAAVEAFAVDRGLHPIVAGRRGAGMRGRIAAVDVFHDVEFAAGRPAEGGDVVAEQPESGPHSLRFGDLDARFDAAVHETEVALGFEAGGRIDAGRWLAREDVELAFD